MKLGYVIPSPHYTFIASTKTIALDASYDMLTVDQVLSITNLSRKIDIYDCENPKNYVQDPHATANQLKIGITITGGGIVFECDSTMANTDKLQIIVSDRFREAMVVDNVEVFTSEILAVSGESGHSVDSTGDYTGDCDFVNVYVSSTGSSTSLAVTISGSPDSLGATKAVVQPLTFGATASTVIVPVAKPPNYLWASADNGDAANGAVFSVLIEKHRRT